MGRTRLSDHADNYLRMRKNQGKATSTLGNEESSISKLTRYWDATRRSSSSLDVHAMEDFLYGAGGLAERLPHAATFNTQLTHLRGFIRHLVTRDVVRPDVLDVMVSREAVRGEYVRVSMLQVQTMIRTCDDPYERWVLAFASQTMARDSELKRPRLAAFHEDTMTIDWFRQKTHDHDQLFITADLADELRRWKLAYQESVGGPASGDWYAVPERRQHAAGGGGRLDNSRRSWIYHPHNMRKRPLADIIQKHVSRVSGIPVADLKGQGVHLIRRSMARALYDRLVELGYGDPLRMVMSALGHANPQVTELYLGIRPDRERRNKLLAGSNLLSVDTTDVIRLEARRSG